MKLCAIIPVYKPQESFIEILKLLEQRGFDAIIAVDDGSGDAYAEFFERAAKIKNCTVLRHFVNYGKGRALKTALNYFCLNMHDYDAAVTADADNQHDIDDIVRCASLAAENRDALVLGVRDFDEPQVPFKSRTGNKITRWVMGALCGVHVSDTQTGLRAVSPEAAEKFLATEGERYEYETNVLLETKRLEMPIIETPIKTIYIDRNQTSHFNPLTDSVKIYLLIVKFASSSIFASLTDILLFMLLNMALKEVPSTYRILIATAGARLVSSFIAFFVNMKMVFGKRGDGRMALRYFALVVLIAACSYGLVLLVTAFTPIPSTVAKIVIDGLLFLVSFRFQREWVFRKK